MAPEVEREMRERAYPGERPDSRDL